MSGKGKQKSAGEKNANDKKDALKENDEKRFLQWKLISHKQINSLLELTVDEVQQQLEEFLGYRNHQTCLKEAALLDYYVSGFWWAKGVSFSCPQMSFTMAVLQLLLDNIRDKQMPLVENYSEFAKAIAASRQSPALEGDSNPLLDTEQAMAITDYLKTSLFQNYTLYEFLFSKPREELLLGMERSIEVIRSVDSIFPLEEGMPADVYFRYLAPPPAQTANKDQGKVLKENPKEPRQTQQQERHGEKEEGEGEKKEAAKYSIQDVKEILGDMSKELLGNLQV
ncbi:ciliary-associated calcium-binding coiled-coil protein 1 [Aplochiton taeniatus]